MSGVGMMSLVTNIFVICEVCILGTVINSSIFTHLTPSMQPRSSARRFVLILFGTASKIMLMESFIILHVVTITIIENIKVHSGSTEKLN